MEHKENKWNRELDEPFILKNARLGEKRCLEAAMLHVFATIYFSAMLFTVLVGIAATLATDWREITRALGMRIHSRRNAGSRTMRVRTAERRRELSRRFSQQRAAA